MKRVPVEDEYAKNPNITKQHVQSVLDWVEKQPHLPKISELDAIFFLNCYSGSIELAKRLIEVYYTTRTHLPEFYSQRSPKKIRKHLDVALFHHLETKSRAKVLYGIFMDADASNFSLNEQIKILGMVFDAWYIQEGTCDTYEAIIDMKGINMGHVTKLNIVSLKKGIHILQEALQVQIKYIHIINVLPLIDKIMALMKPFMKKDLFDKIIFHSDGLDSLYKYIPKSSLLQHLGGEGVTLKEAHEKMIKMLLENEEYFQEEETKRVDESKRVGKAVTSHDLFGIEDYYSWYLVCLTMKPFDIKEQYEKIKNLKKTDVKSLLSWVDTQSHLPKIGEEEVILFLHSCFYDLEKAKHTIDAYYTCRTHCPEIFENWNVFDENLQKVMDVMVFQPISEPTHEGHKVMFLKFQDADPWKFNVAEQIKVFCMSTKLWLMEEGTAEGHVVVMDMSDISAGHLLRLKPFTLKKFFYFLQEAIPFRLKGIHFFDCYSIIDKLMIILRPFLKEDLVFIHTKGNIEQLYKYIPKKCLPNNYGGLQPSVDELHTIMKKRLTTNADYLREVEKTQRVNENLRPGKKDNCSIS